MSKKDSLQLPCPPAGHVELSIGSVAFHVEDSFRKAKNRVSAVFLRPALRKTEAVNAYQTIIGALKKQQRHWGLFSFEQRNAEKILLKNHQEIARRTRGGLNGLFENKRFLLVAHQPEDACAEFIRAISPNALLVVVAGPDYIDRRSSTMRAADLAIAVADTPVSLAGANLFTVGSNDDIAPLIRNWIDAWIFGRNKALVPFFGAPDAQAELAELIRRAPQGHKGDLALLTGPRSYPNPSRNSSDILSAFSGSVTAAYITLAMRHRYWGLLQSPDMSEAEILASLLQKGATAAHYQPEPAA